MKIPNSEAHAVPFKELRFTILGLGVLIRGAWCCIYCYTDGKTKLTVAFRNFAKAPKKTQTVLFSLEDMRHQEQLHLHT